MNPTVREAEACAKLILLGEHFVLHGAPALAIALPSLRLRLRAEASSEPGLRWYPQLDALLQQTLQQALPYNTLTGGWRLQVAQSQIPQGMGLGSSAALCVALLRLLSANAPMPPALLAAQARELEHQFHAQSSGLDPMTVAFEAPVHGKTDEFQALPELWRPALLLFSAGGVRHSAHAVARSSAFRSAQPQRFEALLLSASKNCASALQALRARDAQCFGKLLDAQHALLQELGVSTPGLDRCCAAARSAGALGAKLSGAGCGGYGFAACEAKQRPQLEQALRAAGATALSWIDEGFT